MKRFLVTGLLALSTALFAGLGTSCAAGTYGITGTGNLYSAGLAANGIGASRHNMGALGRVLTTDATSEICIFCHTPHHSNTDTKPLWNRNMPNSSTYVPYGQTVAGTNISGFAAGSVSLACLSCHDGVTAFDNLVNAPGKGLNGGDQQWQFKMPNGTVVDASYDHFGATGGMGGMGGGGGGGMSCDGCHAMFGVPAQAARLNIGVDLTNDHPVSVAYVVGTTAGLRPASTTINNINLTGDLSSLASTFESGNLAQNRWAVSGFISDTATIGALLRNGRVECSSCHDPHFKNQSWDEVDATYLDYTSSWCITGEECSDGMFLRRVGGNTGSGVCRTCHDK